MAYRVSTISLAAIIAPGDKQQVPGVPNNKPIGNVSIVDMPAGATFQLHYGEQDPIPVKGEGAIVGASAPEDTERGLFFSNDVAQPGVSVKLLVAFAAGLASID